MPLKNKKLAIVILLRGRLTFVWFCIPSVPPKSGNYVLLGCLLSPKTRQSEPAVLGCAPAFRSLFAELSPVRSPFSLEWGQHSVPSHSSQQHLQGISRVLLSTSLEFIPIPDFFFFGAQNWAQRIWINPHLSCWIKYWQGLLRERRHSAKRGEKKGSPSSHDAKFTIEPTASIQCHRWVNILQTFGTWLQTWSLHLQRPVFRFQPEIDVWLNVFSRVFDPSQLVMTSNRQHCSFGGFRHRNNGKGLQEVHFHVVMTLWSHLWTHPWHSLHPLNTSQDAHYSGQFHPMATCFVCSPLLCFTSLDLHPTSFQ